MYRYRNFLTYVATQEVALDLRPLTVMVGSHDERIHRLLSQIHDLCHHQPVAAMEIHNLLRQFRVDQTPPPELENLLSGHLYERLPLDANAQVRHPHLDTTAPTDPGPSGETLFSCFANLPECRKEMIMSHLTHVFGSVEFQPVSAPTYWKENGKTYNLQNIPGNRLHFFWLLCALYDQNPLKLFFRPERGLAGLPGATVDALVSAFRNACALGQVIVITNHADVISRLTPEELLLVPPRKREGIWASEVDPEFFDDKRRLLRYAMGFAA